MVDQEEIENLIKNTGLNSPNWDLLPELDMESDPLKFSMTAKEPLNKNEIEIFFVGREDRYFYIHSNFVFIVSITDKGPLEGVKKVIKRELFMGRPIKLIKFKNTSKYILYWEYFKDVFILRGTPLEIYKELEKRGLTLVKNSKEIFFSFLNSIVYFGYAHILREESMYGDGIFYDDGFIISNLNGYFYLNPEKEIGNLQHGLIILNDLSDYFKKSIFKTVVCYSIAAPFSFVIKKNLQRPFPFLILQGRRRMGKSTLARLAISMWYGDYSLGEKNPMTPAQFHKAISSTTLPIVLNDIDKLIGEEPKIAQELKNIFENIELKEYAHTGEKFYSFSMPIFTTNKMIPLDPAIRRRTYILQLTEDVRRCQDVWEIDKPDRKFKYLSYIGRYVLNLVSKNWIDLSLLEKDPLKIGEHILSQIYNHAKVPIPDWFKADFEFKTAEVLEEEEEENILEELKVILKRDIRPRSFNFEDIQTAIRQGRYTTFYKDTDEVLIFGSILKELEKVGVASLRDLEEVLKDYKAERKRKGKKRSWVIVLDYTSFMDLMGW